LISRILLRFFARAEPDRLTRRIFSRRGGRPIYITNRVSCILATPSNEDSSAGVCTAAMQPCHCSRWLAAYVVSMVRHTCTYAYNSWLPGLAATLWSWSMKLL